MLKYNSLIDLDGLGWKPRTKEDKRAISKALMAGRELAIDARHGVTVCADNGIYIADLEQDDDYFYLEGDK